MMFSVNQYSYPFSADIHLRYQNIHHDIGNFCQLFFDRLWSELIPFFNFVALLHHSDY